MNQRRSAAMLVVGLSMLGVCAAPAAAQDRTQKPAPKVPTVSVVGCASRTGDGWELIRATAGVPTQRVYSSTAEIQEATKTALGRNRYRLLGTAEFVTPEELLKTQQRGEFTRPAIANATGALKDGAKVVVKGLLIDAPNEKRVNLLSVQRVADTCK